MKIRNKKFLWLGIAMFICLAGSGVSYGMDKPLSGISSLPNEIRAKILLSTPAIDFLTQQPITFGNYIDKVGSEIAAAGDKVATGGIVEPIRIWDITTGKLLRTIEVEYSWSDPFGMVDSIAINGDTVIAASSRQAKIWNINTGQLLHTLRTDAKSIAIDGDKIVTDSTIWDLKTGTLLRTLKGHTERVISIAIAGDKVITGSTDHTAKIWDINTGQLLHTLRGHTEDVSSVAVAGDKVLTGSWDKTAKMWDINTGKLLRSLRGTTETKLVKVAGDKVMTRSDDWTIGIWDISTSQLIRTLEGYKGAFSSITIANDKVIGESNGIIKVWPLSINLKGTAENNPLLWILHNATIPQLEFINRAYQATAANKDLIIAMPTKLGTIQPTDSQEQIDGNTYFSFPDAVRAYLRSRLNIKRDPITITEKFWNWMSQ